jgi:hypothetical protein
MKTLGTSLTSVEVLKIEEASPDYLRLKDDNSTVGINSAYDERNCLRLPQSMSEVRHS